MTTQAIRLTEAFEQLAEDVFSVESDMSTVIANLGDVTTLTTSAKESAVAAINSIDTRVNALELDAVTLTNVNALIAAAKSQILGGAAEAHDTLGKISAEITTLKDHVTASETAVSGLQTDLGTLQSSVTALGENKADKTALQTTQSTLTSVETTLNGLIDDGLAAGSGNTYSIDKILEVVASAGAAVKQDLLGGAGAAYDTLQELKMFIDDNADLLTAINGVVANCVSFVSVQALTDEQKVLARTNIMAAGKLEFDAIVTALGDLTVNYKQKYLDRKTALGN